MVKQVGIFRQIYSNSLTRCSNYAVLFFNHTHMKLTPLLFTLAKEQLFQEIFLTNFWNFQQRFILKIFKCF